jgi:cob(I)alamin adenosyltransferase
MVKLYTGLGDDGTTGLLGEGRVEKSDIRLDVMGCLDELSAFLGLAKCQTDDKVTKGGIENIQRDLYAIMTEVAATPQSIEKFKPFSEQRVVYLEKWVAEIGEEIEVPHEFILPGETLPSAVFSICRTQTRKAERRMVGLFDKSKKKNGEILRYLNRLSTLLFLLEIKYSKKGNKQRLKFAKV